jgi:deoxyxylulose-5-phosphate synthase
MRASPSRSTRTRRTLRRPHLHLPDRFIDQASPAEMYADAGLTSGDIAAAALDALGSPIHERRAGPGARLSG